MVRCKVLDKSLDVITGERQQQYGSPEDVFRRVAELWSTYLDTGVSPEDVCHMMTLLKIARMRSGEPHADNYIDSIGYQALAAEIAGVDA